MTHSPSTSCRGPGRVAVERQHAGVTGVEVQWVLIESGSAMAVTLEVDLVDGVCRLMRRVPGMGAASVVREAVVDGANAVCVGEETRGFRAVTIPGVLMVVESPDPQAAYVRSPWLDALRPKPGCCELESLRVF